MKVRRSAERRGWLAGEELEEAPPSRSCGGRGSWARARGLQRCDDLCTEALGLVYREVEG